MTNATPLLSPTQCTESEHVNSTAANGGSNGHKSAVQPKVAAEHAGSLRERAMRLLEATIEYRHSPSFDEPQVIDEILGPFPVAENGKSNGKRMPKAPPGTPPYLASLYEVALLSREQEQYLFRKMNFLKYRTDQLRRQLNPRDPQPKLVNRIERMLAEALTLRNRIVRANLRLVVSIAKKLVDSANSFDDLVSDGNVPLIRAAEIFDFERGTRFSTYATWAVRNSLYRATPRNRRRSHRFVPSGDGLFEGVTDSGTSQYEQETRQAEMQAVVNRILSRLSGRDKEIVTRRFGLDEAEYAHKFREIAEKMDISTERVRQLLGRSLSRIKQNPEVGEVDLES